MFQDNPCTICGELDPDKFKIYFDGYIKLFRCKTCGFVSQFPGPGKLTIVTNYKDSPSLDFLSSGRIFKFPQKALNFKDVIRRITSLKGSDLKILDIGCGDGHFLYWCKDYGFDCYGAEENKQLAKYVESVVGCPVIQGHYNKAMFPKECFDVISMIQVLEHIPTPVLALETVLYHLKPNGIIVIEVPSIMAPHFITYRLTGLKWFVQRKSHYGVIYGHFGYYSPKSLRTLINRIGFKEIQLTTGRWQNKHKGILKHIGNLLDPVLNTFNVGGILFIGKK